MIFSLHGIFPSYPLEGVGYHSIKSKFMIENELVHRRKDEGNIFELRLFEPNYHCHGHSLLF